MSQITRVPVLAVTLVAFLAVSSSSPALPPGQEDAWQGLSFGVAAFDEVVDLARREHLRGEIDRAVWAGAACGALRALDPPLELLPRAFAEKEPGNLAEQGQPLVCPGRPQTGLILVPVRPEPQPTSLAEVKLQGQRRRERARLVQAALAWIEIDRPLVGCVLAAIEARLPAERRPEGLSLAWRHAATFFLKALDPHSDLLPNRLFAELEEKSRSDHELGVGIDIIARGRKLIVVRVQPESPAARQGTVPGDRLLTVDGRAPADVAEAEKALAGAEGSSVRLGLVGKDGRRRRLTLIRAPVRRSTVNAWAVGPGARVAVVRLPHFASSAAADLGHALDGLARAGSPPAALVLDLRGNLGGWVEQAVAVADLFLGDAPVATMRSRYDPPLVWRASAQASDLDLPILVLVDGRCRSSCELLAAALSENRRALLIGARTFGKGSAQGVWEARQGPWSVFLTVARYDGPSGRSLQAQGIEPDVTIEELAAQRVVRESDMATRLEAEEPPPAPRPALPPQLASCAAAALSSPWAKDLARTDRPLAVAAAHADCLSRDKVTAPPAPPGPRPRKEH
jgi:carboxyl-terminal processing protease